MLTGLRVIFFVRSSTEGTLVSKRLRSVCVHIVRLFKSRQAPYNSAHMPGNACACEFFVAVTIFKMYQHGRNRLQYGGLSFTDILVRAVLCVRPLRIDRVIVSMIGRIPCASAGGRIELFVRFIELVKV